jgi:hypothetical protein
LFEGEDEAEGGGASELGGGAGALGEVEGHGRAGGVEGRFENVRPGFLDAINKGRGGEIFADNGLGAEGAEGF